LPPWAGSMRISHRFWMSLLIGSIYDGLSA
jgi:hypothetical protein